MSEVIYRTPSASQVRLAADALSEVNVQELLPRLGIVRLDMKRHEQYQALIEVADWLRWRVSVGVHKEG